MYVELLVVILANDKLHHMPSFTKSNFRSANRYPDPDIYFFQSIHMPPTSYRTTTNTSTLLIAPPNLHISLSPPERFVIISDS